MGLKSGVFVLAATMLAITLDACCSLAASFHCREQVEVGPFVYRKFHAKVEAVFDSQGRVSVKAGFDATEGCLEGVEGRNEAESCPGVQHRVRSSPCFLTLPAFSP